MQVVRHKARMQVAGSIEGISGIKARLNPFNFFKTGVIYGTSDAVRRWSSAVKRFFGYSPALELEYIPAWSSEVVRRWCSAAKDTSNAVRRWCSDARGHCRTRNTSNPRCGVKNNKALIKAENLKDSSDTRRMNSSDTPRRSSRSEMGRFVEPVFKTDDRR
jgi:hypothetical protein